MKVKIELDEGESMEDSDEFLARALKAKQNSVKPEKYHDQVFEDILMEIDAQHQKLLNEVLAELTHELKNGAL